MSTGCKFDRHISQHLIIYIHVPSCIFNTLGVAGRSLRLIAVYKSNLCREMAAYKRVTFCLNENRVRLLPSQNIRR